MKISRIKNINLTNKFSFKNYVITDFFTMNTNT